jgi:3-oxoadipate enol-lactonase
VRAARVEGEPESGFAEVNGASLYYESLGQGEPVVLLHAGIADGRMWDEQFGTFAEGYRVVRYDRRGFGRSAMVDGTYSHHDDLRGVLDHLGIEHASFVGCSMGGGAAIDFALGHPERPEPWYSSAPRSAGSSRTSLPRRSGTSWSRPTRPATSSGCPS